MTPNAAAPAVTTRAARAAEGVATRAVARFGWVLKPIAVAGAIVAALLLLHMYLLGAWPLYDTACFWVAGLRLRTGVPIYGWVDPLFTFRYAPPWAVLWIPLSFIPLQLVSAGMLTAEILAYRYICGSWVVAGAALWLPFGVGGELSTGNVNLLMAAAILVGVRGSGVWPALFSLAKFSPAAVLVMAGRRQWLTFSLTILGLCALTLPWLDLWPAWVGQLFQPTTPTVLPFVVRLPIGLGLLAYRRRWSAAAGAAMLTPALYSHSLVLFLPAFRLALEDVAARRRGVVRLEPERP